MTARYGRLIAEDRMHITVPTAAVEDWTERVCVVVARALSCP